jgi:hypothetical protein
MLHPVTVPPLLKGEVRRAGAKNTGENIDNHAEGNKAVK